MLNLDDCKLITNEEYCELDNPSFEGQTRVVDNIYYMCWSVGNQYYKTRNEAVPSALLDAIKSRQQILNNVVHN